MTQRIGGDKEDHRHHEQGVLMTIIEESAKGVWEELISFVGRPDSIEIISKALQAQRDDMRKEMEKERDEYYETGERRGFHRATVMAAKVLEDAGDRDRFEVAQEIRDLK